MITAIPIPDRLLAGLLRYRDERIPTGGRRRMKNRLTDLNDYLFAQLERLADEDLSGEQIAAEITRTSAIVQVADKIVTNARLQLDACKLIAEHGDRFSKQLPMIAGSSGNGNGPANVETKT